MYRDADGNPVLLCSAHHYAWRAPELECFNALALGTNASSYWGGAQREGKEAAYTPTRGKRGAKARQADRLVCRVLGWLHRNAVR